MIFRRLALGALLAFSTASAPAAADDVTIFAAASLTNALNEVASAWQADTGHTTTVSYAGSSTLANQIQAGAPADIFISASSKWMDALEGSGDLANGTRRDILGNRLVLIAHGRDAQPISIDETLDLAGLLGDARLAMALVDSVPAGIYGREALTWLGLWNDVEPLIAQADNVRAALAFVSRNEAPYGIVYATDAAAEDDVTIVGTFPAESHTPVTYPAAITAQNDSGVAVEFLDYLTSPRARTIWLKYGFGTID